MSVHDQSNNKKVTVPLLKEMKKQGQKIVALTAYDFLTARSLDKAGVDIILIGDSLGMVFQGLESTLPVTLEQILYHTQAVRKGVSRAMVVADMPFLSYQISEAVAIENAGRLLKEGGANAVKIEGGTHIVPIADKLIKIGIPVIGHIGLTPQSINQFGSYKVRAKEEKEAAELLSAAKALDDIGVAAIVLEKIPAGIAANITSAIETPTIGIGAGNDCDGQILVTEDMLGIFDDFKPKFVRRYANLSDNIRNAVEQYVSDVREKNFPADDESY